MERIATLPRPWPPTWCDPAGGGRSQGRGRPPTWRDGWKPAAGRRPPTSGPARRSGKWPATRRGCFVAAGRPFSSRPDPLAQPTIRRASASCDFVDRLVGRSAQPVTGGSRASHRRLPGPGPPPTLGRLPLGVPRRRRGRQATEAPAVLGFPAAGAIGVLGGVFVNARRPLSAQPIRAFEKISMPTIDRREMSRALRIHRAVGIRACLPALPHRRGRLPARTGGVPYAAVD